MVWVCAAACAGALFASAIQRVGAFGVPLSDGLVYSGLLTDARGAAIDGSRSLQLQLWDRASGGTARCSLGPQDQAFSAGRFSVRLPADCTSAVQQTPNLWMELSVDGGSLGRSKLGSVPYALEAAHSTTADDASGTLATRLSAIERQRVVTNGHDTGPLHLCRGQTSIGGTDWKLQSSTELRVTVDISSCGFAARPLILSELVGREGHSRTLGGSNPTPPTGNFTEAQAFDIVISDATQSLDPVNANADQWHIEWIAVGD
jgi:hypothetical protein